MGLRASDLPRAERASFGAVLRSKRTTRIPALTQQDLATLMGVSRAQVNLMEQGRRSPTREFVTRAVEALDLPEAEAAHFWETAGFVPPTTPLHLVQPATKAAVEQELPSSEQNPILAYVARADTRAVMESWRSLAEADRLLREGRYDQARDRCTEVARQRHATPSLRLFARRKLAEANRQLGNLDDAEKEISAEVVQADLPEGDTSPLAAVLRALLLAQRGEVELRRGHYEQGRTYFEASQEGYAALLESASSETSMVIHLGLGMAFERMAKAALFLGDQRQAEDYCTAAELHLEHAAPCPQRDEVLRKVVELRAWALAREGDFEHAIKFHEEARDAARAAGDVRGVLKNCVYLGDDWRRRAEKVIEDVCRDDLGVYHPGPPREIYDAAQQTEAHLTDWVRSARRSYEEAMRLIKTHPAPYMMGLCLRNLGIIARFQGKFADADALLHRAERYDSDLKLQGRLPAIYEALGDLYWWQGMHELATKWYTRALQALDELLSPPADAARSQAEQRDTAVHARERSRVLAALESLLPLPAAQHALDRWRTGHPDTPDTLDKLNNLHARWHETTAALERCIIGAIHRGRGVRVTTSASDLRWISELAAFEAIPGPRVLAQDSLSAGWTDALPDEFLAPLHTEAEFAAAKGAFQRRRVLIRECAGVGYRDLATEPTVLAALDTPVGRLRAQNVLAALDQYPGGYSLTLSRFPLTVAFTIKGNRVLAEVPAALLTETYYTAAASSAPSDATWERSLLQLQSHDTAQPPHMHGALSRQDVPNLAQSTADTGIWCYRFDDANVGTDLRALYDQLEDIAVRQGGGDAARVLRHYLSTKRARETGVGV